MTTGWYPTAKPIPVPGFWSGNRGRKAIVMHIVQGSAASCINEFKAGSVSSHFLVGKDGTVYQFVSIYDSAWANGLSWSESAKMWQDPEGHMVHPPWSGLEVPINPNLTTVSVEHEGSTGEVWTPAMIAANNALVAWVAAQFNLHIQHGTTLIGHCDISPISRPNCPGTGCTWSAIEAFCNPPSLPFGTVAVDPALRAYYDRSGGLWQPDRYCLGYAISPLDPATKIQKFERGALRLRSDGGVDALLRSEW